MQWWHNLSVLATLHGCAGCTTWIRWQYSLSVMVAIPEYGDVPMQRLGLRVPHAATVIYRELVMMRRAGLKASLLRSSGSINR